MADLTLYHASPSRSSVILWMLEELGEPYDIKLLKLSEGEQLKPDYLAVNPMGKVPTLKHNGVVITEGAAICTAASISNGCSSGRVVSNPRSSTAPRHARKRRAARCWATAISTPR